MWPLFLILAFDSGMERKRSKPLPKPLSQGIGAFPLRFRQAFSRKTAPAR